MKAIISVFISAYLPSMASFECRADSVCGNTNQTPCHHTFNHDELAWAILRAKKQYPIGYCITYLHYVSYQFEYAKAVRVALNEQLCRLEQEREKGGTQKHNVSLLDLQKKGLQQQSLQKQGLQKQRRLQQWLQQQEDKFCQALHHQLTQLVSND
ncbi:hypothetical protein LZI70_05940 [Vibrio pelagius]|uniref:Secreted protein n=1 Tax=Vibrio pelagius TaxID=28169 RepID=A0ABY5G7F9_VIBPE|nr:hypothetical protein [Vibrio pelagius]UTT85782.1 hypothetical protein LZI70_05940 [Vibrio pelagius]